MRPTGKTFREPVGQWPRHRMFELTLAGTRGWPDTKGGEPRGATREFHALQGEGDAAVRRALHQRLDALLDTVLPRVPPLGPEYVVWRLPDGEYPPGRPYTWAHKVASRRPGKLELVCGQRLAGDPSKGIYSRSGNLIENWGECIACAAGRHWDDELTGQLMAAGRGP